MVVQKTGLLTFSMQGSWEHPNLSTNSTPGSGGSPQPPTQPTTPTKTQDPISLELTVTAPQATGTATPPSSPPTTGPNTITKKFTLSAGQSCTLQIPVQAEGSILQLKYDNPNKNYNASLNNQGNGGTTAAPAPGNSTTPTAPGNPTTTPAPTAGNPTTTPDPTPVGITLKSFAWSLVLVPGEITAKTTSTTAPSQP